MNPREHVTHMPPSSANKVTHSGFETGGGNVTKIPKQGYPWPHKKDLCPLKIKKKVSGNISAATTMSSFKKKSNEH